jgi:hypothetical protein
VPSYFHFASCGIKDLSPFEGEIVLAVAS